MNSTFPEKSLGQLPIKQWIMKLEDGLSEAYWKAH